jgi:hypothetical protein
LRPLRMNLSPARFAIRPTPVGRGRSMSKFAVPLPLPGGSLAVHPPRKTPVGSEVAAPIKRDFCSSVPYQATGIRPRPLHSTVQANPGSTTQISSAAIVKSRQDLPSPPYSPGSIAMAIPALYASI